jgi:hypothetical protein
VLDDGRSSVCDVEWKHHAIPIEPDIRSGAGGCSFVFREVHGSRGPYVCDTPQKRRSPDSARCRQADAGLGFRRHPGTRVKRKCGATAPKWTLHCIESSCLKAAEDLTQNCGSLVSVSGTRIIGDGRTMASSSRTQTGKVRKMLTH